MRGKECKHLIGIDAGQPLRLDTDLLPETRAQAEELPMSLGWFRQKRRLGGGPPFVRIGSRVFYRRGELREWIAQKGVR